jgi:hypothetical protein
LALLNYGYTIALTWNYTAVYFDVATLILMSVTCLLLITLDVNELYAYDTVTIQLLEQFAEDYALDQPKLGSEMKLLLNNKQQKTKKKQPLYYYA